MGKISSRSARRTTKKTKAKNGKALVADMDIGGKVPLNEQEQAALKAARSVLIDLKAALADLDLQRMQIEQTKVETAKAIVQQQDAIRELARAALTAHGFDPARQDRAWQLSVDAGVIVRTA